MKLLTLFRHAKSSWDDSNLDDHDRPLAPRGHRDAERMAKRLARQRFAPDLLLTSTAVRAGETANYLAPALGLSGPKLRRERAIYLATPDRLLRVISAQDDGIECLLLVGHNPGLTELANSLLPELHLDNLPTAGVVAIDCDVRRWSEVGADTSSLRFYDSPKKGSAD